jgi:hypothetical protein
MTTAISASKSRFFDSFGRMIGCRCPTCDSATRMKIAGCSVLSRPVSTTWSW